MLAQRRQLVCNEAVKHADLLKAARQAPVVRTMQQLSCNQAEADSLPAAVVARWVLPAMLKTLNRVCSCTIAQKAGNACSSADHWEGTVRCDEGSHVSKESHCQSLLWCVTDPRLGQIFAIFPAPVTKNGRTVRMERLTRIVNTVRCMCRVIPYDARYA